MSSELKEKIDGLRRMSREQLKHRWRALYKAAPPMAFTPDLLARGIAWKLQERVLGGLSPEAKASIGVVGAGKGEQRSRRSASRPTLRPGNRLVRRWRGRTYVVEANLRLLVAWLTALWRALITALLSALQPTLAAA